MMIIKWSKVKWLTPLATCIVLFIAFFLRMQLKSHDMMIGQPQTIYFHFSLDDVRGCTTRLSMFSDSSVFADTTLSILKEWHDKYGICVSLYVQGDFCVNSKYAEELIENSSWLRFGYHGVGDHKKDVRKFYKQVRDSIGTDKVIDCFPRLDFFHANRVTCLILKHNGCRGFLSCDDWSFNSENRKTNYYLSEDQSQLLDKNNRLFDADYKLFFAKTDFRLEQIAERWGSVESCLDYYTNNEQSREMIVFSHEWNFHRFEHQADSIFQWAVSNNYKFAFPEDE